jgi:hypothetical protein
MYNQLCKTPSDINEHLPILKELASECEHVTEMGVRYCVSTWAFVEGLKKGKLVSIDIKHPTEFGGDLKSVKDRCTEKGIDFEFILGNTLEIEIEPTDLLFIDTLHTAEQIEKELARHGDKARKYIAFHDTESCKEMVNPIVRFMDDKWSFHRVYSNNNGLTIIKRNE